ncbi:perlucin-like protein [Mytilus trossulus]|uniref:perlucin-like protein n=1 Tax=Mytilus trossulus TaxID=6551 RepID=UPI0030075C18
MPELYIIFFFLLCGGQALILTSNCQKNWIHHGNSCYLLSTQKSAWQSAVNVCRVYGGTLAVVNSAEENKFLNHTFLQMTGGSTNESYWLDGWDFHSEGTWKWSSTKQEMAYKNFYPGQPDDQNGNEDCLVISAAYNGQWADMDCYTTLFSICEKDLSAAGSVG